MNKQAYYQGYEHGASSTIDQKRGARDAFDDRKKKERKDQEYSRLVEKAYREHNENELRISQELKREQERKKREYEQSQQQKVKDRQAKTPQIKRTTKTEWSTGAAIVGFLICAVWAATQAQGLGAMIIAGLIGAVVMGHFYEVIIGFSILIMIFAGVANYI